MNYVYIVPICHNLYALVQPLKMPIAHTARIFQTCDNMSQARIILIFSLFLNGAHLCWLKKTMSQKQTET